MEKNNIEEDPLDEKGEMCKRCGEEPVFMNGLCEYCYEDDFHSHEDLDDDKSSKMIVHGQNIKDPQQMDIARKRNISKILKIKKRNRD